MLKLLCILHIIDIELTAILQFQVMVMATLDWCTTIDYLTCNLKKRNILQLTSSLIGGRGCVEKIECGAV